jgi:tRNA nucleotidyltransferase/poly(A) polymerase
MLKFFHDNMAIDDFKLDRFAVLKKINGWYSFQFEDKLELWISRFCILFADLSRPEMKRLASRFEITGRLYDELAEAFYKFKHAVWQVKRLKDVKASAITDIFDGMKTEAVTAAVAVLGQEYEWLLKEYLTVYRFVAPSVDGNDLKAMGIPPSGVYGEILKEIKRAKLDHEISSKEEELTLAKRIAGERGIKF